MPWCAVTKCDSRLHKKTMKKHYFQIPKNESLAMQWEEALQPRKALNRRSVVCEKHFKTNEILWEKTIVGSDGLIVGVTKFQYPRLREGAVPSLFLPRNKTTVIKEENTLSNGSYENENSNSLSFFQSGTNNFEFIKVEKDSILESIPDDISNPVIKEENEEFNFEILQKTDIDIPENWIKQVFVRNNSTFLTFSYREFHDDIMQVVTLKELIITEDLQIFINFSGQSVNPTVLGLNYYIYGIEMLNKIIKLLDKEKTDIQQNYS